jgi:hypothetical protein
MPVTVQQLKEVIGADAKKYASALKEANRAITAATPSELETLAILCEAFGTVMAVFAEDLRKVRNTKGH